MARSTEVSSLPPVQEQEEYALDEVHSDGQSDRYRDSTTDEEDYDYHQAPENPLLNRFLRLVGMGSKKRNGDYFSAPHHDSIPDGLLKKRVPNEVRRCRRSRACFLVKRIALACPLVLLMLFGILHVLQVLIGRARLFWDVDAQDEFLPNFGKSGHFGEGIANYPTDATRDVLPIPCHSHNDYWRRVPLFDAIHWGCTGVEADVWLFDEELYVGHNMASLTRNRTFQNLYVNPLVELLDRQNPSTDFVNATGHGVFDEDGGQTLVLLVDFKTEGRKTWPAVLRQLEPLRSKGYLTYFDGEKTVPRAVTVVGTGNTPFDLVVQNTTYRDVFFDAPLDKLWEKPRKPTLPEDLDGDAIDAETDYGTAMAHDGKPTMPKDMSEGGQGNTGTEIVTNPQFYNTSTSYYASVSFSSTVGFVWRGHLSPRQMDIIRGQIRGAKRRGLKARYWETPSWPIGLRNHIWHVLTKEGADVLNVDDLKGATTENWKHRVRHDWW